MDTTQQDTHPEDAHPPAPASNDATITFGPASADETQRLPADSHSTPHFGAQTACGRFRIVRAHKRGGLGQIYVARDVQLGREVALKEILAAHADDADSRGRFVLEAEVTGNLEHPGFVPVYALGHYSDGRPYYAMRLIRGESLKDAIERLWGAEHPPNSETLRTEVRRLVRRLIDVCNAMAYAHSRGVIHRDIKPANILLGPYGETLVVDWGLAKVLGQSTRAEAPGASVPAEPQPDGEGILVPASGGSSAETLPGHAVGTPAFMSPEQAAGERERLGPACDIYSLGATLYQILAGRIPFGEDAQDLALVLSQVQYGAFRPPREIEPRIPRALEAICLKAMARKPEERYATMIELAEDLERWLADEPVSAFRESWANRVARWARRHKAWTVAAGATALAIALVLGLTAEGFRRAADRERSAREQSLRIAAKFAARTVAAEIDLRWRILENSSDEPELVTNLLASRGQPADSPPRQALQRWIETQFVEHRAAAAAANWFLTDARGIQIERAPYMARNIGVNYAYRDYFHGRGRDLPEGTADLSPLQRPHRSIVFRSKATGSYTVVFSVPVRDPATGPQGPVIGVLGMSVDVGHFGVLQLDVGDDQLAVLADLRPDAQGRAGLVLHHPGLRADQADMAMVYLDSDQLTVLDQVRREALQRRSERRSLPRDAVPGISHGNRPAPLPGSYRANYRDPVGGAFAGDWRAAFEPVIIEGRPDVIDDTGWIVLVQERPDPNDD